MSQRSVEVAEWLKIARKDWERVLRNFAEADYAASGFFLQQSLEKYMKAFLINQGWKLRKIHELEALLDEIVNFKPDLDIFYELCERVSGYYLAERYPPLGIGELSKRDLERDIEEARKLIQSLFPNEPLAP
jgi:HEPN domain-containing protein